MVDAAVALILSQNTSNANSTRALASMNDTFPGGAAAVLAAPESQLEESIRCGGLSKMKASRIHALLRQVNATARTVTDMAAGAAGAHCAHVGLHCRCRRVMGGS